MGKISLLKDSSFLKALDRDNNKTFYTKILILNQNEDPIESIEGKVSGGNITIDGNSNIRRAGNITFVASDQENDLQDINNLLTLNKKIKISIGIENNIDKNYDDIIWFEQGVFVITQPSITHSTSGVNINLSFKDKMCLLNGECGGNLPTSITFNEYDQTIGYEEVEYNSNNSKLELRRQENNFPKNPTTYTIYGMKDVVTGNIEYFRWGGSSEGWAAADYSEVGEVVSVQQRVFDIIQTLVANFGGEAINRIVINDIPLELKASVRYIGSDNLYYNSKTGEYTLDEDKTFSSEGEWIPFDFNQDCGYIYTDFTFPGELISSIGDNVCSVLDKIVNEMGNYEYFYDLEGNFVFQEIKNYLNTQFDPVAKIMSDGGKEQIFTINGVNYNCGDSPFILGDFKEVNENEISTNYAVDYSRFSQSIYSFDRDNNLISSYGNSPDYLNIKNDFHIWGENQDENVIHYHLVIKNKPSTRMIRWVKNEIIDGEYTGKILLSNINERSEGAYPYTPSDWRAELYLQGLEKKAKQIRPDIYEQELLDLFGDIYDFTKLECEDLITGEKIKFDRYELVDQDRYKIIKYGDFRVDIIKNSNELNYWFDYLNPIGYLHSISVDAIGTKIQTEQKDNVVKLYNTDIPDIIMINRDSPPLKRASLIKKSLNIGEPYSNVSEDVYKNVALGTIGYTAQEVMRELLYQYTDFTSAITLSAMPIYYLDANTRITVNDRASNIYGDYIIKTISLPLDGHSAMSISASKVLERI